MRGKAISDMNTERNPEKTTDNDTDGNTTDAERNTAIFSPFVLRTFGRPKVWARYE
jgi:hypothetical protein